MPLTLTLLRHAKSLHNDASLADFDRPLAPRGESDAPRMGAWMKAHKVTPDLVLCSPSVRTRQTLALVGSSLPAGVATRFQRPLYLAEADVLLAAVLKARPSVRHLLLVGHNPGYHEFAGMLVGDGPPEARQSLAEKFPTCGCAVLRFDVEAWKDVAPKGGTLLHWMAPKRLA